MDQETVGNIVLLVIVTLISVVQNGKGQQGCCEPGTHSSVCTYIMFISTCFSGPECVGAEAFLCEFGLFSSWTFFCLSADDRPRLQRKDSNLKGW